MIDIAVIHSSAELEAGIGRHALVAFIHKHLERFRDDIPAISRALDYIFDPLPGKGGFILLAREKDSTLGALVMLKTGMSVFVPQNLLVYFAVDAGFRGKGLGSLMLGRAKELCEGDIALHVEPDNPARHLYERHGFGVRYVEMRWKR